MEKPIENPTSYRVEVSSWDEKENFLVEKTTLDWTEGNGKKIELRAPAAPQAVVFVRLSQQLGGSNRFPVPFRAVEISQKCDGYQRGEELITCGYAYPARMVLLVVRECSDSKAKRERIGAEIGNQGAVSYPPLDLKAAGFRVAATVSLRLRSNPGRRLHAASDSKTVRECGAAPGRPLHVHARTK